MIKSTGPYRADIPVLIALNECEKIEEQVENIENNEKRFTGKRKD